MGAFSATDIAENSVEDFIDDGITTLVYSMANCYFNDEKKQTNNQCEDIVDKAFNEALEGAGNTLKFTIMSAVIYRVSTYGMAKIVAGSAFIYSYIKAGRIINTIKRKVDSSLQGVPFVGKFLGSVITASTAIAVGNQNERLAMADMANNNINNVTQLVGQERQTASMQVSAQKRQVMQTLGLNHDAKGLNDAKKIEAYNYKMKTGTWNTTTQDKKLFLSVIPKEYITDGFSYNSSFVKKLNQFTEYAKTTEDNIVNLTQVLAKTLATKGAI